MSESFNYRIGLIVLPVELFGPSGSQIVRMALDTGATRSLVNIATLVNLGYDPSLESERTNVSVLAHTLPPSAAIDGLLGLDFFRDQRLEIDFRHGRLTLD